MGAQLVCFWRNPFVIKGFDSLCWKYEQDSKVAVPLLPDHAGSYVSCQMKLASTCCLVILSGRMTGTTFTPASFPVWERFSKITAVFPRVEANSALPMSITAKGDLAQPFLYRGRPLLTVRCAATCGICRALTAGENLFWPGLMSTSSRRLAGFGARSYIQQAAKNSL